MKPTMWESAALQSIDGGRAVKAVDFQIGEVIKNINDPNTEATAKRAVVLKITFSPAADRRSSEISYRIDTKLPGDAPGVDRMVISTENEGFIPSAEQLSLDVEITTSTARLVPRSEVSND
jgi:hypothetical protein